MPIEEHPSGDMITMNREELSSKYSEILRLSCPVWRKNSEGELVIVPVSKMSQYLGDREHDYIFYIEKDWQSRGKSKLTPLPAAVRPSFAPQDTLRPLTVVEDQVERFHLMSIVDREELLDGGLGRLDEIRKRNAVLDLEIVISMVEVVANTFYANHANLVDLSDSPDILNNIQGIISKTKWMLGYVIDIVRPNIGKGEIIPLIEQISTESPTFDHINRVLLRYIAFSLFINRYIDQGFFNKNIRAGFAQKYLKYYRHRLDIDTITPENVFKDGFRRIDESHELPDFAFGALLFDMGKIPDLKYHDSGEGYDEKMVKKHVLHGYNMIMNTKSFHFTVPAMAAFHHEQYGHREGYNFTNAIISKMNGVKRDDSKAKYFITYSEKEFISGAALALFPVKVLEIVDIFDAITSKKKNKPREALVIMKSEFIQKSLKIDPVLFTLFLDFCALGGMISSDDVKEIDRLGG